MCWEIVFIAFVFIFFLGSHLLVLRPFYPPSICKASLQPSARPDNVCADVANGQDVYKVHFKRCLMFERAHPAITQRVVSGWVGGLVVGLGLVDGNLFISLLQL
jgi:hypothetical protein